MLYEVLRTSLRVPDGSYGPYYRVCILDLSVTRVCMEGLTVTQSAPDGPYGPYDHITPLGNAQEANFEARARINRK